jgi:hypothetical protein
MVVALTASLAIAADAGQQKMLEALLRPAGWSAEWSGPGGAGLTDVVFERRSDQIVAKIRLISPLELTCENPVTLQPNGVTFDGCRDPAVTLVYDPNDPAFPLRGRSPRGYEWKVKPK